jgi:HKD family nuclease
MVVLIVQSLAQPAAVRHALADLLHNDVRAVRIASAYTTMAGSQIVYDAVRNELGGDLDTIPKRVLTSFDFGLTEPQALRFWQGLPNTTVYVSGIERLIAGSLRPKVAFHPKVYSFQNADGTSNVFAGSANMTSRGLSVNTEAGWSARNVSAAQTKALFEAIRVSCGLVTDEILEAYAALRAANPPPPETKIEIEKVPAPRPVDIAGLRLFWDAMSAGLLEPSDFGQMWVQAEKLQGGSENQLELPRGTNHFFGYKYANYAYPHKQTIGTPPLKAGASSWNDKILSWHGNNQMERLNLPTLAQGGFTYTNSAILFRRLPGGKYEFVVAAWDSDLARSWREASANAKRIYRIGRVTKRLAGFI